MSKVGIFVANGCEEIEALTVVDLLRRAQIDIEMISITDDKLISGAHGIDFWADVTKNEANFSMYDGIILPGGLPGTDYLREDAKVKSVIQEFNAKGKLVAAICAAPTVLENAGILENKKVTSYPSCEDKFKKSVYLNESVVADENIITSRGMGTAIDFSLEIIKFLKDEQTAQKLAEAIVYK